jgi:hypothetical protein
LKEPAADNMTFKMAAFIGIEILWG